MVGPRLARCPSANSTSSHATSRARSRRAALGIGDDCALLAPRARHAARGVERHAGRRPALPVDRRARAARPQGAGGQPERPGGLRRRAAGLHAGAGAAARRRRLPRRLRARPVRAGRRARLRAGRRRHHARAAEHLHHRLRRGAGRRRRCCARARAPATTLWVSGTLGDARLALEVFRGTLALGGDAFDACARAHGAADAARRARPGAARHRDAARSTSATGCSATSATCCARSGVGATLDADALPRSAVLRRAAAPACSASCLLAGGDDYELRVHRAARGAAPRAAARAARGGVAGHAASAASRPRAGPARCVDRQRPRHRRGRLRRASTTSSA